MKNQEDNLFNEWRSFVKAQSDAVFVSDGIVNYEKWESAPVKVLYLLKEPNGNDKSKKKSNEKEVNSENKKDWDERDYLANYNIKPEYKATHSPTIDKLIKWQFGINFGAEYSWDEVNKKIKSTDLQNELLSQICLVNVKKTEGGSLVDWDKFDKYFKSEDNKKKLNDQLDIYTPDVVICGNTAWCLCNIKKWDYDSWPKTSRGVSYYKDKNTLYIDFCHPDNRGPQNMIYYALLDALTELNIIKKGS